MLIILVFVIILISVLIIVYFALKDKHVQPPVVQPPVVLPSGYKITKYVQPDLGSNGPTAGVQKELGVERCSYASVLKSDRSVIEKLSIIENHYLISHREKGCDQDCDNVFIQQLYESYLIKNVLMDYSVTSGIMSVYNKVFEAMKQKINKNDPGMYDKIITEWVGSQEAPYYPVSQQRRPWSKYKNPNIMKNLSGIEHDYTEILLGGNFIKEMSHYLDPELATFRDYSFNNILKRVRGYRTNQKNRDGVENQVGIVNFDYDKLGLDGKYYKLTKWQHPGRSKCNTNPIQGAYQHETKRVSLPLECGISGSTNFWLWTALYSGAQLDMNETRLFLLSAFIVLGADGGHSLNEVLSAATINAMMWKNYLMYSKDQKLSNYFKSDFARNLYNVTREINPIGQGDFLSINKDHVANNIYNNGTVSNPPGSNPPGSNPYYGSKDDTKKVPDEEKVKRQELESFFTIGRRNKTFGHYSTFLDQMPELGGLRKSIVLLLTDYIKAYC